MKRARGFGRLSVFVLSAALVLPAAIFGGVKDSALKAHINFGTCVSGSPSSNSRSKTDYNIFVCENAMKWDATEPSQGNFTYGGGDQVATWCTSNGCLMRGHTMVWGGQTPAWVTGLSRLQMLAALKNHITNLMNHFKGQIVEWDIVNEAVSDASTPGLKGIFWQKQIGNDYLDSAFTYAYQADSNVYLYYNDYSGEKTGKAKSDYIYNMVKSMKERHIPIHGVGLQCHITAPVPRDSISANIKRIGDLGLRVSCTEIDITNGATDPTSWSNLVQACVENYNATSFVCWGFDDAHSWKGSNCACQLWDVSGQPRSSLITAVEKAFAGGDPQINAQRQEFLKLTPSDIFHGKGTPIALENALRLKSGLVHFSFDRNTVEYNLASSRNVRLVVTDVRGKTMVDLQLGMQSAGRHSINLPNGRASSGCFIAQLYTGNRILECRSYLSLR